MINNISGELRLEATAALQLSLRVCHGEIHGVARAARIYCRICRGSSAPFASTDQRRDHFLASKQSARRSCIKDCAVCTLVCSVFKNGGSGEGPSSSNQLTTFLYNILLTTLRTACGKWKYTLRLSSTIHRSAYQRLTSLCETKRWAMQVTERMSRATLARWHANDSRCWCHLYACHSPVTSDKSSSAGLEIGRVV
jgi:hypothetical protein